MKIRDTLKFCPWQTGGHNKLVRVMPNGERLNVAEFIMKMEAEEFARAIAECNNRNMGADWKNLGDIKAQRARIVAKARERASRFPYFPHGDALRNFANELEAV